MLANWHGLASDFIRALIEQVPEGRSVSYIGTAVFEDLLHWSERTGEPNRAVEYLLRAARSTDQLFLVLAGVYPHLLARMRIEALAPRTLSEAQVAWLLDDDAPKRHDYL